MAPQRRGAAAVLAGAALCAAGLVLGGLGDGRAWAAAPPRAPRAQASPGARAASAFGVGRRDGAPGAVEAPSAGRAGGQGAGLGGGVRAAFAAACLLAAAVAGTVAPEAASAGDKRVVGEIPANGLIFKDTINVEEFDDPKVKGVNLYISDFSKALTDRLSKGDFFSDPGSSGLSCVKTGPILVSPDLQAKKEGEDVFTEGRSLLFKTLRVKRVYDAEAQNVVYVVFTDRLDNSDDKNKSRFQSQVCALHADGVQEPKK